MIGEKCLIVIDQAADTPRRLGVSPSSQGTDLAPAETHPVYSNRERAKARLLEQLSRKVNIHFEDVTVEALMKLLGEQYELDHALQLDSRMGEIKDKKISCDYKDVPLGVAMEKILRDVGLAYSFKNFSSTVWIWVSTPELLQAENYKTFDTAMLTTQSVQVVPLKAIPNADTTPTSAEPADGSEKPVAAVEGTPSVSVADSPIETIDLEKLPVLTPEKRQQLNLDAQTINMLREVSEDRPYGLAIINRNKVVIGGLIPDTKVKLIGISRAGIGIEDTATGERYFMKNYTK